MTEERLNKIEADIPGTTTGKTRKQLRELVDEVRRLKAENMALHLKPSNCPVCCTQYASTCGFTEAIE